MLFSLIQRDDYSDIRPDGINYNKIVSCIYIINNLKCLEFLKIYKILIIIVLKLIIYLSERLLITKGKYVSTLL